MIKNDEDFRNIIEKIHKIIHDINTLFVVNSLKYMKVGGRIGGATVFLGKVINIKPLCEFINSKVHTIKPIIGRKKSLRTMIDKGLSRINSIDKSIIIIQNAKFEEDADYMSDYLRKKQIMI